MVASWQSTVETSRNALEAKLKATGFAGQVGHIGEDVLNVTSVPFDRVLTAREIEITELGVGQLLAKLSGGELTSEELTVGPFLAFDSSSSADTISCPATPARVLAPRCDCARTRACPTASV